MQKVNGVLEVYFWLVSNIGQPINEPAVCSAQLILDEDTNLEEIAPQVIEVTAYEFDHLDEFCNDLATGKISVC